MVITEDLKEDALMDDFHNDEIWHERERDLEYYNDNLPAMIEYEEFMNDRRVDIEKIANENSWNFAEAASYLYDSINQQQCEQSDGELPF